MRKFWISFVALLMGVVLGVGIWHGIAHGDKMKVFAENAWEQIKSTFKKSDDKPQDEQKNVDEFSLNGLYYYYALYAGESGYISFDCMETSTPCFMYLPGFEIENSFYRCKKYKQAPTNDYVWLEKKNEKQSINYYYNGEMKFSCNKESGEFGVWIKDLFVPFQKKIVSIKSALDFIPVIYVDESNRVASSNCSTIANIFYRGVGEDDWKKAYTYELNTLIADGSMTIGSEYEIKMRFYCVCGDEYMESAPIEYTAQIIHPNGCHDWSTTITKESTCSEEGSKISTCKICGEVVNEIISKKQHSFVVEEDNGITRTLVCCECGEKSIVEISTITIDTSL